MEVLEALSDPIFKLPKLNNEESFELLLSNIFGEFIDLLDKIDERPIASQIQSRRNVIDAFCKSLIQSTVTYYSGYPAQSYFEFEEAMKLIVEFLFPEKPGGKIFYSNEPYYRARKGANELYDRYRMFHPPFEMREYVSSSRFSIPGLPCLYLSNSVYVCWEELRRPDINKMQVARLKLENYKLDFLDLSLTPEYFFRILQTAVRPIPDGAKDFEPITISNFSDLIIDYLMKWPLIAACSIKVKREDGSFKPEYIFPQFLLQWVTHKKLVDGIKYFSIVGTLSVNIDRSNLINYAIPVKNSATSGMCKYLSDSFSMTESVSWEALTMTNPNLVQFDPERFKKIFPQLGRDNIMSNIEFIKGKSVSYWHSIFGKLELELGDMTFLKI